MNAMVIAAVILLALAGPLMAAEEAPPSLGVASSTAVHSE